MNVLKQIDTAELALRETIVVKGLLTTVTFNRIQANLWKYWYEPLGRLLYGTDSEVVGVINELIADVNYAAWHKEEMKKPQPRVVYSPSAQQDMDDTCTPHGQ